MGKKVVSAGHICIDITPAIGGNRVSEIGQMLLPGKLINVGAADVHTGGSVANTGLAMKILGADVYLAGKTGDDAFGDMIQSIVSRYGAEKGLIRKEGESSSYSVVLAVPGIDRIFLHHPGANDTFTADDLSEELMKDTVLFHFGYPPLMKKMYENEGEGLLEVMKKAKAFGAATSMDLAAVDPASESGRADWKKILEKVLPYVDIFVPSIEELYYMLDRPGFDALQKRADGRDVCEVLSFSEDIRPLADQCMAMGTKILLIKCGAPGMYYRTSSEEMLQMIPQNLELDTKVWADREGFEKSYVPERVLSGTGAGDTSIAAFLTSLLKGFPPEKCMQYAAATGACCVAAYDALSGLLPLEELENRIRAGWSKNEF